MVFNESFTFNDFVGHHTLFYGETDTKKTYFTAKFVQFLIEKKNLNPREISILDFAPSLSVIKGLKIGGKIVDYYNNSIICNNLYFEGEIIPARLNARNLKDLYDNACNNYRKSFKILKIYIENPTNVLIINDVSIYLHIGNKKLLLDSIEKSNTFLGNSYYGSSIKSDFSHLFSLREKRLVNYLIKKIEYSYFTG
jgi:hypothetical protein